MKYVPLIWFGIWRRPLRATLILLQVAVAFALFGVLQGMKSGVDQLVANVRADVLFVGQSVESSSPLPVAYVNRLRRTPGIKTATFLATLGGTYQNPTQRVSALALENNDAWQTLLPAILLNTLTILPKDHNTRTGALVTAAVAKKYGWHIGDRIPMVSRTLQNNGSGSWFFDIVGILPSSPQAQVRNGIFINYDYLDQARAHNKDTVTEFVVVVSDPKQAAVMSEAIDRTFANSSSPTDTASVRAETQQAVRRIGDLHFLIRSIVSVLLVALVFSIATMMMQTVRERTPELAVLKTLGFSDLGLFGLVVVETLIVCTGGALIGLAIATRAFPFAARFVPVLSMPTVVIAYGLVGAVLISLISVSVPALRAAKLQVVDGLAGR
jgi:putative ABC transport system permease protein